MKAIVNKWGNSLAVRIPQPIAEELGIGEGTAVDLAATFDSLVIRKRVFTLEDFLEGHSKRSAELDWGAPQGNEIW